MTIYLSMIDDLVDNAFIWYIYTVMRDLHSMAPSDVCGWWVTSDVDISGG